jgi:hypothetical protein
LNRIGLIIALLCVAFLALVLYTTLSGPRYRVEVCMSFESRLSCKTVSGKSKDAALRGAITNACADIVGGVSETMRCEQANPQSVKWLGKPDH